MGTWELASFPEFLGNHRQSLKTNSHVSTFTQYRQCIWSPGPTDINAHVDISSCPLLTCSFWQARRMTSLSHLKARVSSRHMRRCSTALIVRECKSKPQQDILSQIQRALASFRCVCTRAPLLSLTPSRTQAPPFSHIRTSSLTWTFTLWDCMFLGSVAFFPHPPL